jgi:hypothetical protein
MKVWAQDPNVEQWKDGNKICHCSSNQTSSNTGARKQWKNKQHHDGDLPFGSVVGHIQLGWMHHNENHTSAQVHTAIYWMTATLRYALITLNNLKFTSNERLTILNSKQGDKSSKTLLWKLR